VSSARNGFRTAAAQHGLRASGSRGSGRSLEEGVTYRSVATASAFVSFVFGAVALVVPDALAFVYGITAGSLALLLARLLGGSYLGYAIANFMTRERAEPATRRAVAAANAVAWAAGLVVSVYGQLQGVANGFGWATVAMQLVFTLAWTRSYLADRE
jgi:hypothetical protein